jgi:Zn finger protein HypA/HybF involved in hydrogenase expression
MFLFDIADDMSFVAVCECCGETYISKDYESFCSTCQPIMNEFEQQEAFALEAMIQDNESYQEYLREHS